MYIIKIKGKAKIPDYLQVRDNQFTLIAYTRIDRPEKALEKCGLGNHIDKIKELLTNMPFGIMTKLELND